MQQLCIAYAYAWSPQSIPFLIGAPERCTVLCFNGAHAYAHTHAQVINSQYTHASCTGKSCSAMQGERHPGKLWLLMTSELKGWPV